MKTFIFNKNTLSNNLISIEDKEFNHLKNVMRLKVGDEISCVCFDENTYYAKIEEIQKNRAICKVFKIEKNLKNPQKKLTVFQALIKNEHMNLCVQKLTEVGISELVTFESMFCTVKKSESKLAKLQEISNQSIKQCGRSIPIKIHETISFKNMLKDLEGYEMVIFANEKENSMRLNEINYSTLSNVAVIVGSEGGFSEDEIRSLTQLKNVKSVSLGKRILRAETASIVLSSIVLSNLGEI